MYSIEYRIDLDGNGKPMVVLDEKHLDKPFDKYMIIEMAKYIIYSARNSYVDNRENDEQYSEDLVHSMEYSFDFLNYLSGHMDDIVLDYFRNNGFLCKKDNKEYLFSVTSYENLVELSDSIINNEMFYDHMLFKADEGITVLVVNENKRYSYFDDEWILID